MSNADLTKFVKLADGEEHPIRFTFNALVAVEGLLGESITKIFTRVAVENDISFTAIRALLWAGLNFGDPNRPLTPAAVGELMEGIDIGELVPVLTAAMENAFPNKPKSKIGDAPPVKNPVPGREDLENPPEPPTEGSTIGN